MRGPVVWKYFQESFAEWATLTVVVVLLFGAFFVIKSWFRKEPDGNASDHELLIRMTELHRQGDLSQDEFRSIRSRLVNNEPEPRPRQDPDQSN